MVRVTGSEQVNFHHSKLSEAMQLRDDLCEKAGIDPFKGKSIRESKVNYKIKQTKPCLLGSVIVNTSEVKRGILIENLQPVLP